MAGQFCPAISIFKHKEMTHFVYEEFEEGVEVERRERIFACTCGWAGNRSDLRFGPRGMLFCPLDPIISRHNNCIDSDNWEEFSKYAESTDLGIDE